MRGASTHTGMLIDEKYQVLDTIGVGGMSVVWLARDSRLGKLWAIKEIKPNEAGVRGELMRQALVDEAHLMKRLDHPAIPRVVDIIDTGMSIYVVMDYVEGRSLSQVLGAQGSPFDQDRVIEWGLQLCDVLSYLHSLEPALVYRDMKPSNVMLREDGSLRLIDFGITMELGQDDVHGGKVVGTPGYAAPEQLGGTPQDEDVPAQAPALPGHGLEGQPVVDGRADIYALGMTLYTLVTGHRPKKITAPDGTTRVSFETKPIRTWNPRLYEGLELIILRATQADPANRYPSIEEMRYDLEHHLELTHEWQKTQRRKVRKFYGRLVAAALCATLGILCAVGGRVVRGASYEERLRAASLATTQAEGEGASAAERELAEAVRIDPGRTEAYDALLGVYKADFLLSRAEEARLRKAFGSVEELQSNPTYAKLCFDVGICYLCYYGVDQGGGAVGNAGIASIEGAEPWFRRAIASCAEDADSSKQTISAQDLKAARTYLLISGFYNEVTRSGREGTSGEKTYRELWDALVQALEDEAQADSARKSAEGVRARLCQVTCEALSSSTYLGGFARAGVTEIEAQELLKTTELCVEDLSDFANAQEYREVYGPMFAQINEELTLAHTNISAAYHNPVANLEKEAL